MASIEEQISVSLKNGWKAIIYDAPWAYFKENQDGILISPDRKACETIDDNKDFVVIVADVNATFKERDNGHILFRQKGSDLFDIVCLKQEDGGTYELSIGDNNGSINTVTINGCNGTYSDFKDKLKVYETINGVTKELKKDEYIIKKPDAQYFVDNIPNDGTEPKVTEIAVSSKKYSQMPDAIGSLIITTKDDIQENIDKGNSSIDLSNINVEKLSETSYVYSIRRTPDRSSDCNGGTVTFTLESTLIGDAQYLIHINDVEIVTTSAVTKTQCNAIVGRTAYTSTDISNITFSVEGTVTNVTRTETGITLSISDNVTYFTVSAENNLGIKGEISFYRDSADGNFKRS